MKVQTIQEAVGRTSYPGRGIIAGKSADGKFSVLAYFIMGRSVNSRNRVFVKDGDGIRTQAHDPAKLRDPSLIIYAPVRRLDNKTVVTNGDQTDTVISFGGDFDNALMTRTFEPDAPNYTPRVSAMTAYENGDFALSMSILRAADENGARTARVFWHFDTLGAGEGYFLHTYQGDGNPIPAFEGDPEKLTLSGDLDDMTDAIWNALDRDNRVSLWVEYRDLSTGTSDTRIVNARTEA